MLSLPMNAPAVEMTLDGWAAMDEDDEGELVDGILVEEEMPSMSHELTVAWLVHVLRSWLSSRGGFVFGSDGKFAVAPRRGRKPDLTVYLPGSRKPQVHGVVTVPPDIVVEIITATPRDERRDRVEKVADYARFGVRWYWLVDPSFRTFEVLERAADGRYVHAAAATDDPLASPGCDGLVIDVRALWAEIERLEADDEPQVPEPAEPG
jgi:Uma2 family endonuclease